MGVAHLPAWAIAKPWLWRIWTPMATWTLWWVTKGPTKFGGSNKNTVVSTWDLGGIFPLRQLTLEQKYELLGKKRAGRWASSFYLNANTDVSS
jgi:hypothetical protein